MKPAHDYNLTVADVAKHYALTERTIRSHLKAGRLKGVRIGGLWRCSWRSVWSEEQGPLPKGEREEPYRRPLLTKRDVARQWGVSERTIERWIVAGLPTRNVFGNVRIAPEDLGAWVQAQFGVGDAA